MTPREARAELGVAEGAGAHEIKAAYRRRAKQAHPDLGGSDEAYARLRLAFEALVGQPRPSRPAPGTRVEAARVELSISLDRAFEGGVIEFDAPGGRACAACGGSGGRAETTGSACAACAGQGVVKATRGMLRVRARCPACEGSGEARRRVCGACRGTGAGPDACRLRVDLPPGVADGALLPTSSPAIEALVRVAAHPAFERAGADLFARARVSFASLCLGGIAVVPGLGGERWEISLPAGSEHGALVDVEGAGMPDGPGRRGRLRVALEVAIPARPTPEQARWLERWRDLEADSP